MTRPDTDRERNISNEAYQKGINSVLVDLFEGSDKKRVIRSLWGKAMSLVDDNTTKYTEAELKAYAAAALHCYHIMKSNSPALETHGEEAYHWDGTPTKQVYVPLTAEDVSKYGSRGGH